jgi:carbamoyl-phosphate synthase small subunit
MTTTQELNPPANTNAALVLADGTVFWGYGIGAEGQTIGEICFNTSMTGYQEILTDPSYAGQIITFTFPHIGNTGINEEDVESGAIAARGLVIREPITDPANFRSTKHLNDWLIENNVTGISGVDTRALTKYIRLNGAQNAHIAYYTQTDRIGVKALINSAKQYPALKGAELAESVTCAEPHEWTEPLWELMEAGEASAFKQVSRVAEGDKHIVAVDFGVKRNILRNLTERGCKVTVVPARTSDEEIFALKPDGVFLSNGPGDPAATGAYAIPMIKAIVESGIPVFGICLGHQMLALSQGCVTEKMHQGHRGANHPVQDVNTTKVEITSQNHGFVVSETNLPNHVEVTHKSLFDGTVQGIRLTNAPVFSVQGHPEASPGPHDSAYLFDQFVEAIAAHKNTVEKKHA